MYELLLCTIGCSATLIAGHIGLWNTPWRLSRPAAYSVGTATLGLWFFIWSLWIGLPIIGLGFLYLAGMSGAPIIIAYWVRSRLALLEQRSRRAGAAASHPLSQEHIDRGDYGPK